MPFDANTDCLLSIWITKRIDSRLLVVELHLAVESKAEYLQRTLSFSNIRRERHCLLNARRGCLHHVHRPRPLPTWSRRGIIRQLIDQSETMQGCDKCAFFDKFERRAESENYNRGIQSKQSGLIKWLELISWASNEKNTSLLMIESGKANPRHEKLKSISQYAFTDENMIRIIAQFMSWLKVNCDRASAVHHPIGYRFAMKLTNRQLSLAIAGMYRFPITRQ